MHFFRSAASGALLLVLMFAPLAFANKVDQKRLACATEMTDAPLAFDPEQLDLADALKAVQRPLAMGEHGFRIVHNDGLDTPDPAKPVRVRRPDGVYVWLQGFSGHRARMATTRRALAHREGEGVEMIDVRLFNSAGRPLAEEGLPYAQGSAGWDLSFAVTRENGVERLIIYAGTMDDAPDGRPLTMNDHAYWTRVRRAYNGDMRMENGKLVIEGHNPWAIVPMDRTNFTWLGHHYGGGPTLLENGEVYLNDVGLPEMDFEMAVEELWLQDEEGTWRRLPKRTVVVRCVLDKTLKRAITLPTIVLDVYDPQGKPYPATLRPNGTYLIEGPQTQVLIDGEPAESNEQLRQARAAGRKITKRISFSSGEYFREYGGHLAYSDREPGPYTAVLNDEGTDFYDVLAPFRHFMVGGGRIVNFVDEDGNHMANGHASFPLLSKRRPRLLQPVHGVPQLDEEFLNFARFPFSSPVRWRERKGGAVPEFLDNTGWLGRLKQSP